MNTVALEAVIRARILASAPLAGQTVQGCWSTGAPPGIEVATGLDPFVVFNLEVGEDDDSMNKQAVRALYRVDIFDHRSNVGVDGTIAARIVYDAIYGDGNTTTDPTYGLHRWRPTVSGFALSRMRRVNFGAAHQDEILNWWSTFEVLQEEA